MSVGCDVSWAVLTWRLVWQYQCQPEDHTGLMRQLDGVRKSAEGDRDQREVMLQQKVLYAPALPSEPSEN